MGLAIKKELYRNPVRLNLETPISTISCTNDYTLYLDYYGIVYFYGNNIISKYNNQKLLEDLENNRIVNLPKIIKTISNNYFSALITESDDMYAFGTTPSGEYHTPTKMEDFKAVDLAIATDGRLVIPDVILIGTRINRG